MMNFAKSRYFFLFLLIPLLFGVSSCTSSRPSLEKKNVYQGESICSVALLPFINDSRFEQGNLISQRVFAAELSRIAGIEVSSEGDVQNIYQELHIFPHQHPDIEQIRVLGSRLDVQLVISGRITEMEEKMGDSHVNPVLALTLQVYDAKSGKTMWTTYHRREGRNYRTVMHFGLVNTVTQLSRVMSDEIIEEWFAEGMKQCGK
jgi:TolB-like protein